MSPIVTPKEAPSQKPTSVRLPASMVAEIEQVARDTGRSRTEVIVQLLRYALDEHSKDPGRKPKK